MTVLIFCGPMPQSLSMGVCSILLFATSAAAATSTPLPLLKLRGGEVKPLRYGMETGKYTARPAVKPQKIVNIDPMEVGDTEKVYVLQQFEKPEVRLAFMRKVYSIVTAQLAVTALIVYVLRNVPGLLPGLVQKLGTAIGLLPLIPLTLLVVIPGVRGSGSNLAYLLLAIFTCETMVALTLPALLRGDTCCPIEARPCEAVVLPLGTSRPLEPWWALAEV